MTVLYINDEHCLSLSQLRGYFSKELSLTENIYYDLIDNGREHIISAWLRENGEPSMSSQLDEIDPNLCDSDYFLRMADIILYESPHVTPIKPDFKRCFVIEGLEREETPFLGSNDTKSSVNSLHIKLHLRILLSINESYELTLETSLGSRSRSINPYDYSVGESVTLSFGYLKGSGQIFFIKGLASEGKILDAESFFNDLNDFVDLGLSVKWSRFNLGAGSPEDYGDYYAWGETSPKSEYREENSKTNGRRIGDIGGNPDYDAATATLGKGVRLPSRNEFKELVDNCESEWTEFNGVCGRLYTSKINGNSIFLPAAGSRYGTSLYGAGEFGYYWSSSPYEDGDYGAYCFDFDANGDRWGIWYGRYYGRSVRPVQEF